MTLLELDPNVVKPGWTPLLILIGLAVVMFLLFRSMRRQFRKVDAHYPRSVAAGPSAESADEEAAPGDVEGGRATTVVPDGTAPTRGETAPRG